MIIGVPRETKPGEARVALLPQSVRDLVRSGVVVRVESMAGSSSGYLDSEYHAAGAVMTDAASAFEVDLVVKVKELQPGDLDRLRRGSTVFCFQHLATHPEVLDAVLAKQIATIAFETVQDDDGALPCLAPMSKIAGALAPQLAAQWLCRDKGGSGVMLCAVDRNPGARVLIIGAGNAGCEAARIALNLGASVWLMSRGAKRLAAAKHSIPGIQTEAFDPHRLNELIAMSDVVIAAVLEPGRQSPTLIERSAIAAMRPGSVYVDIGIDRGGISETSRLTTLQTPTYVDSGVTHYCVPNTPALVPRTASAMLDRAIFPYVRSLSRGIDTALRNDSSLARALQTLQSRIVDQRVLDDRADRPRLDQ